MRERFTPFLMHAFSHLVPRDSQVKWSCRGPKPPPQSSHQGNWYPTCLTSRPCIKAYTVALNSGHRVRRARNLPGGSPVNVQTFRNCLERTVLNETWTEDFETSLAFWLNGFTWELNRRYYYYCYTTRIWTAKWMGIQMQRKCD